MKPHPVPHVPGNTEAERMNNAVRKLLTVSKEDYLKEEARLKRALSGVLESVNAIQ
jgi:hypothetical protein